MVVCVCSHSSWFGWVGLIAQHLCRKGDRMDQQLLSIIVPMYNEAANARPIYDAIAKVLQQTTYNFEMIFVDDGSHDETSNRLMELVQQDERVRSVELARNF